MMKQWILETNGEPLAALRKFIMEVWTRAKLDYLLLPLKEEGYPYWMPRLINQSGRLEDFNPFAPVMTENISRHIPLLVDQNSGAKIGVLLRPCEGRALKNMSEMGKVKLDKVVTMTVDCLGTFPLDEYEWRAKRKGARKNLEKEALQFARQGGIAAYRYRAACQVCESPIAGQADISFSVIGLPVRQYILVNTFNGIDEKLDFADFTSPYIPFALTEQREKTDSKVIQRQKNSYERISNILGETIPHTIDTLQEFFDQCGECQICMQNCPICEIHVPQKTRGGEYDPEDIIQWLTNCAGCGMCEQNCPSHKPIPVIFANLREQLAAPGGYALAG